MTINNFLFSILLVFATIGALTILILTIALIALFVIYFQAKREEQARKQEYKQMERSLLSQFEEMT